MRSYASKGLFDLTAVFPDRVSLIQVKKSYISTEERHELEEFAKRLKSKFISVELWSSANGRFEIEKLSADTKTSVGEGNLGKKKRRDAHHSPKRGHF